MTPRIQLRSHPVGRALFALPLLALLVGTASATEANTPPAGAERSVSPSGQRAFEQAREVLDAQLSHVASNLEGLLASNDVKAAEALYGLERSAIALLQHIESHDIASQGSTHEETVGGVRSMLQRILRYQERVKDYAQEKLDRVLPGEPERKLVFLRGKDRYTPLFRQGTPKPGEAQASDADRYAEMKQDFVAKGGDLKRDIRLLGIDYLRRLESGQLAEWTQLGESKISITTEGAKHPVIGGGKKVRGAGSVKVYRDHEGEVVVAIVSNSSGNYKPGVASVEGLVQKLIELGVPEARILTTSVVPAEPELVKLLLKARLDMTKEQINEHVAQLKIATTPADIEKAGASTRSSAQSTIRLIKNSPLARPVSRRSARLTPTRPPPKRSR